ncbi:MAG: DUF7116 family protein [Halobacteria archaeon]
MVTKPYVSHGRAPLEGRARLVFERLGYSVTYDGDALRAKRDGKTVRVYTVTDGEPPRPNPDSGVADKYCLVTRAEKATALKRDAESYLPSESDWAVIGVETDGDGYFVA